MMVASRTGTSHRLQPNGLIFISGVRFFNGDNSIYGPLNIRGVSTQQETQSLISRPTAATNHMSSKAKLGQIVS